MELTLEQVAYCYGEKTAYENMALHDISLTIRSGEFIGIIGHTGSGKSTLMQLLNGLERPTAGRVLADGADIWQEKFDRRALRSRVGMVFQYPEHQLFETTVLKDVMFGPKNQGLSEEEAMERAKSAIAMTGLSESCYEKSPFELSGGQKRKAAIAGVLAMKPEILILDEPTAGLDPAGRDEILGQIRKLFEACKERMAVLLVSHSMEDVATYVDRILVMDHGTLQLDGAPEEVFAQTERLEQTGLSAPAVSYLMRELAERGIVRNTGVFTLNQAAEAIVDEWRKRTET